MYNFITRYVLLLIFLLVGFEYLAAQQVNRELRKDKNGIKVYSHEAEDSDFDSFTAKMIVDGTVSTFVAVILDLENFPDWGYNVVSVEILETYGDTLQIYYSESEI